MVTWQRICQKIAKNTYNIEHKSNMQQSVIYSNGNQECERAVSLLKSLGHDFHEYMVDEDFTQTEFEMEFGGDAKYPQVAIGKDHMGNLKETLQEMFLKT